MHISKSFGPKEQDIYDGYTQYICKQDNANIWLINPPPRRSKTSVINKPRNWTLIYFNVVSIHFQLISIDFWINSNWFQFTVNWFQFTFNLFSIDFKLLTIYFQKIRNLVVNHQIPISECWKSNGKTSDSYRSSFEIQWQTIKFLYKKVGNLMVNPQIPI